MPTVNEACPCLTQAGHGVRHFADPKGVRYDIHRYPSVILGIPDRFGPKIPSLPLYLEDS